MICCWMMCLGTFLYIILLSIFFAFRVFLCFNCAWFRCCVYGFCKTQEEDNMKQNCAHWRRLKLVTKCAYLQHGKSRVHEQIIE